MKKSKFYALIFVTGGKLLFCLQNDELCEAENYLKYLCQRLSPVSPKYLGPTSDSGYFLPKCLIY